VTKYRHPMFTAAHLDRVQEIMWDVYAVGGAPASVLHQYIEQEDRPYLTASRPTFVSGWRSAHPRRLGSLPFPATPVSPGSFRQLRWTEP